jgi:hypothetical protein
LIIKPGLLIGLASKRAAGYTRGLDKDLLLAAGRVLLTVSHAKTL